MQEIGWLPEVGLLARLLRQSFGLFLVGGLFALILWVLIRLVE